MDIIVLFVWHLIFIGFFISNERDFSLETHVVSG